MLHTDPVLKAAIAHLWFVNIHPFDDGNGRLTGTTYDADGWYFIASPVNGAAFPTGSVATQDIYQLDWEYEKWLNLQNDAHSSLLDAGFQRGTGYLYASKENKTLSVAGEIQPLSSTDDATVTLAVDGWNLIGNPYASSATFDIPYYRLNAEGNDLNTATEDIAVGAMEGVFVQATAANQTATFTAQTSKAGRQAIARTNIIVCNNKGNVLDNAIIRFDGGLTLGKFQLNGTGQDDDNFAFISNGLETVHVPSLQTQYLLVCMCSASSMAKM